MAPSLDLPKFTVVFPLYDDRGQAIHAVKSWLAQRTSPGQFELVIVDAGRSNLAAKIRPMLSPVDRILQCRTVNEATMYNVGAMESRTPWILFTESHVIPNDDCVVSLEKRLAMDDFDAASLGSSHIIRSRFSDVDARSFYAESLEVRKLGLWRCFGLRGMVVRRQVLETVGWFTEPYFRFCETALAIGLDSEGYRLTELPEVIVSHVDTDNIWELAQAMVLGRMGFNAFWSNEPELAARYFGGTRELHCGKRSSPRQVRETLIAASHLLMHGNVRCAYEIGKQCIPFLPTALLGWRANAVPSLARSIGDCIKFHAFLAFWRSSSSDRFTHLVLNQYQRMRESFARLGTILHDRDAKESELFPMRLEGTRLDAIDLSRMSIGFYEPELWNGLQYCWSYPAASVKLSLKTGSYELCFDIRPTGQLSVRRPQFFIDGIAIPSHDVQENDGRLIIRFDCRDNPTLAWTCHAFKPRKAGLPDRRNLGFAILEGRLTRVSSLERRRDRAA